MKFFLIFSIIVTNIISAILLNKFSDMYIEKHFFFLIFYFFILFILFLRFVAWYFLHKNYSLSSSYHLTSFFFIIIYIISIFFYDESLTIPKTLGCLLITSGIFIIEKKFNINNKSHD